MSGTPLRQVAEELWIASDPVSILGMKLSSTMSVVRLPNGGLLLYSPVGLTEERRHAVEDLGEVRHLYAPNLFHHLHLGAWAERYPEATVHAPDGLEKKQPGVRLDRRHGEPLSDELEEVVEEIPIEGFLLVESAVFHRPSRTLLVADLVHNIGRPPGAWTRLYSGAMGFYDRVAISRMIRWTAFSDRKAAHSSLERVLELDLERVVVGHGEPIESGAREALEAAYAWLLS